MHQNVFNSETSEFIHPSETWNQNQIFLLLLKPIEVELEWNQQLSIVFFSLQ